MQLAINGCTPKSKYMLPSIIFDFFGWRDQLFSTILISVHIAKLSIYDATKGFIFQLPVPLVAEPDTDLFCGGMTGPKFNWLLCLRKD